MATSVRWADCLKVAKDAARLAAKDWLKRSQVTRLVILGPTGTLQPGGLQSQSDFRASMVARMAQARIPMQTAAAFSEPLARAWNAWFEGYQVQLSYPGFAAIPASTAPPTPCLPQPIKAGSSSNAQRLTSVSLEREIKSALGKTASESGAAAAVNEFARWFSDRFSAWVSSATLANVVGKGHVPTYAPPYVPVGPVVGDVLLTPTSPPLSDLGIFDIGL